MKHLLPLLLIQINLAHANGDIVKKVIETQNKICDNGEEKVCVKPVNIEGSDVKALELRINNKKGSFSFITYDGKGNKVKLSDEFKFAITGTRSPRALDVDIVPAKIDKNKKLKTKK